MTSTADPRPVQPKAYSVSEACEALGGISRSHLYGLMGDGRIGSVKLGSRRLVPVGEVDRLLEKLLEAGDE